MADLAELRKLQHRKYELEKAKENLPKLTAKYTEFFNSEHAAARSINLAVKKFWFGHPCLNEYELVEIPGIYRFRLWITSKHLEPSCGAVNKDELELQKAIYDSMQLTGPIHDSSEIPVKLFRYAYDLRVIGLHSPVEPLFIENSLYFLQPEDIIRIKRQFDLINGESKQSQRYLQDFEYQKTACRDRKKQ